MTDKQPDPTATHPVPGFPVTYIKPTITRSNIIVGDFTYYSGEDFESRVTHHYEFYGDKLIIGKFCQIAAGVEFVMNGANHKIDAASTFPFYIFDGWHQDVPPLSEMRCKGDTVIGNDVWIGQHAVILPGVRIGDGAIIGLNSVVGSDVAPYTVAAGNPARPVRKRFDDELIELLLAFKWWDKPVDEIQELIPLLSNSDLEGVKGILKLKVRAVGERIKSDTIINSKQEVAENYQTDRHHNSGSIVTNDSENYEKIDLFLSLFRGRNDVYARRWESKHGQKSGYSPVCRNEWVNGICEKPKIKCADCKCRELVPIDRQTIARHLTGKEVIGIYPMLPDETCLFLAFDFDDDGWHKDIAAVRLVCNRNQIPIAVERSRSGNGAHVWLFFDEPIPAPTARRLGAAILTAAMEERHELKFKSYDRLFPNQDTMPKGGFGNLIALPLQRKSRDNGNSVFVDETFTPYQDEMV